MSVLKRPDDILVEFLRARVDDPKNRYNSDSDSFTASAGQTEFVLTPTDVSNLVRCINSVTLNGSVLYKWQDYEIDLENKKIVLRVAAEDGDALVVNYSASDSGEEWIYPDMPISSLSKSKFPRVSVSIISISSIRSGAFNSPLVQRVGFQIDVWGKDNYSKTISGHKFSKQELVDYVSFKVLKAFEDYVNDLYYVLYDFEGQDFRSMPFEEDTQTYRAMQSLFLNGVNIGY